MPEGEMMARSRAEDRASFRSQKGLTLAELLVVVAIVAILATTLLVQFGRSRQQAEDARAIALANQVRVAFVAYEASTGSFAGLPSGWAYHGWNPLRSAVARHATLPPWSAVAPTVGHGWALWIGHSHNHLYGRGWAIIIVPSYAPDTGWYPHFVGLVDGVYRCRHHWMVDCTRVR
jgi:prepilin-type N-terminal cleavage/methylation domain-containing protein